MELWIRTQDKETILKTDRLDYDFSDGHHRIMANTFETLIAEYKTKKRALEVLDEIQNSMKNFAFAKKINGLGEELDLIPNPILIYNMPKEG